MANHNTATLPSGAIALRGHGGIILRSAGRCDANLGESYADIGGGLAPPFCAGWPGQDWTRPPEVGILCKVFPSPLMAKAIPVTGSAGLIGSEVCVYFAAQGRKSLGKIVTR